MTFSVAHLAVVSVVTRIYFELNTRDFGPGLTIAAGTKLIGAINCALLLPIAYPLIHLTSGTVATDGPFKVLFGILGAISIPINSVIWGLAAWGYLKFNARKRTRT